jgi:hypothetical protein
VASASSYVRAIAEMGPVFGTVAHASDSDGVWRWWRKSNGDIVHVQEMTLSHIHNTIVMLAEGRRLDGNPNIHNHSGDEWIAIFTNELRRRAHP